MEDDGTFTRRSSLVRLGGLLATVAGGSLLRAEPSPGAVASGVVTCVLTPELTEGPYYIAGEKLRRNITDGKAGLPLTLRLAVLDASTCRPIGGATVELWHADAGGVYSGFGAGSANRTFLRGGQKTNALGVAEIVTIYPGWYQGRTVHIHVKVHIGGNVVHTGQLFFPDAVTDAVYKTVPYSKRPNRDVRNATDSIFVNGGRLSVLHLRKHQSGYTGSIAMGVHRS
jgi:protocatechuate 3,4-dioxygenase beta subunit